MIWTPLQKLPNNMDDLGKIIFATSFEWCPKCKKSPNLVTLAEILLFISIYIKNHSE